MEDELAKLLNGQLHGERGPAQIPGLENASQLWAMLDDMAASDPATYAEFMASQVTAMKEEDAGARPTPFFCARAHVSEPAARAGTIFINACSHHSMKPAKRPSDPVNLAVSTLREGAADEALVAVAGLHSLSVGDAVVFVDVITSDDHLVRARRELEYRRELCELFAECVEEVHGLRIKRGSAKALVSQSAPKYAGGEVVGFRDAREPQSAARGPSGLAPGRAAAPGQPQPPGGPSAASLLAQLARAAAAQGGGGGGAGGGGGTGGGGGRPVAPAAGRGGAAGAAGDEEEALALGGLRLPTAAGAQARGGGASQASEAGVQSRGAGEGGAVARPPLIQELSGPERPPPELHPPGAAGLGACAAQTGAVAASGRSGGGGGGGEPQRPEYELSTGSSTADGAPALTVTVRLPGLRSASGLQLLVSDGAIELSTVDGRVALALALPAEQHIDSERALSKFSKRAASLCIVAPLLRTARGRAAAGARGAEAVPPDSSSGNDG